jgi:DNA-directed RNA polymerase subunit RPC12/RpoP
MCYVFVVVIGIQTLRSSQSLGYRNGELVTFLCADVITWAFVAVYWCLLWRTGVQWDKRRIAGTLLSVVGAIVAGVFAAVLSASAMGGGGDGTGFGAFIGGIIAIMLWLIATIFLWRETAVERARRATASTKSAITCPTCGYNLTGLTESRCPECGSRFTLDELLALQQQGKAEVEIE